MPTLRLVASIVVLPVVIACSRGDQPSNSGTPSRVAKERAFTVAAETLWIRGSTEDDSLFVDPWYVAAGGGGVFVTDADRGLLALTPTGVPRDGADGLLHRGLLGPVAMLSDSTVVVVRRSDGALHLFDASGRRHADVPATEVPQAQGMCALDEQRLLLSGGPRSLTIVDRRGGTPLPLPFPWRTLRDSSTLLQQTAVASAFGRTGCVIALMVGNEFALVFNEDSVRFHPFIESIDVPAVRHTVETAGDQITTTSGFVARASTAEGVAMDDTLVLVAFGGAGARREGLIDLYDRGSGAYRASVRLSVPIRALAVGNEALYVLHAQSGLPALLALRLVPGDSLSGSARTP